MGNRTGSNDDTKSSDDDSPDQPPADNSAAAQRAKKLAAIKAAVEAGEYDSEDVLDEAMRIMLRRVQNDSDSRD